MGERGVLLKQAEPPLSRTPAAKIVTARAVRAARAARTAQAGESNEADLENQDVVLFLTTGGLGVHSATGRHAPFGEKMIQAKGLLS